VEIVAQGLSTYETKLLEMKLIKFYGRRNLGEGTLVNLTDGGDGGLGVIVSKETRAKLSAANTGLKNGNADLTVYHFKNYQDDREEFSTKFNFEDKYRINSAALFSKDRINTLHGWYVDHLMPEKHLAALLNNFEGEHNANSDRGIYTFIHVDSKEEFRGTRWEFVEKYSIQIGHLFRKPSKFTNKTSHGWTVRELFSDEDFSKVLNKESFITEEGIKRRKEASSGLNNVLADKTIYKFFNLITDEVKECTRFEMKAFARSINWLFSEEDSLYVNDWCLFENRFKVLESRGRADGRNGGKDYNKYTFTHEDGEVLICNRSIFTKTTGVSTENMFRAKSKSNTSKGWKVTLP